MLTFRTFRIHPLLVNFSQYFSYLSQDFLTFRLSRYAITLPELASGHSRTTREAEKLYEKLLWIYIKYFGFTRKLGIFPFDFNPVTIELTPIDSGFFYYYFYLNVFILIFHVFKPGLLFLITVITNFKEEQFTGAYMIQLVWFFGCAAICCIVLGYSYDRKNFAEIMTTCMRYERKLILGKVIRMHTS